VAEAAREKVMNTGAAVAAIDLIKYPSSGVVKGKRGCNAMDIGVPLTTKSESTGKQVLKGKASESPIPRVANHQATRFFLLGLLAVFGHR
jgi:hypothetical protein